MYDFMYISLFFLVGCFAIFLGVCILIGCSSMWNDFKRQRHYYKMLENNQSIFGNYASTTFEQKQQIVASMIKKDAKKVLHLNPESQKLGLKIFDPESEKQTG